MAEQLRQYLLLVRLPNAFTALSNIVVGYFSPTGPANASVFQLSMLMASSALLYVSGIIFNDYFDLEVDRKERPGRPLPSGRVKKKNALVLAVATMVAANIIALFVSPASLAVCSALAAVVLAYDYGAKKGRMGPAAMGGARFLNVLLGASPALGTGIVVIIIPWNTLVAAGAMFAYVYSIALLSRKEAGEEAQQKKEKEEDARKSVAQSFSIISAIIASMILFAFLHSESFEMFVNIALFSAAMLFTWRGARSGSQAQIQNAVRNLVLFIVVLDSAFITAFAGLPYGIASLAIMVPPVILARRFYIT
ncbi:MAG: UbiA family prenyltransferase [Nitrososphaera sp.]|jgi:4-hydroxybenzoate polyprenyltransferase